MLIVGGLVFWTVVGVVVLWKVGGLLVANKSRGEAKCKTNEELVTNLVDCSRVCIKKSKDSGKVCTKSGECESKRCVTGNPKAVKGVC